MKINREQLMVKLAKASSIANYKEAKGIIKLSIKKSEGETENMHDVSFFGADGINTAITTLKLETGNANIGDYFIDANKILGYLKNLGFYGAEEVILEFTDKITIKTDKTQFEFPLENPKSYPEMPAMKFDEDQEFMMISVDSKIFVNRLSTLSKTISHDTSRPILQYANIHVSGTDMNMITTDGFRVSMAIIDCVGLNGLTQKPIEEVQELNVNPVVLSRLLTAEDGINIDLIVSKDYIYAMDNEGVITMKVMNGEYLNARQYLEPVDFTQEVPFQSVLTVGTQELTQALKLIKAGIVNEKEKLVQFNLQADSLNVSTSKTNGVVDEKDEKSKTGKDSGTINITGSLKGAPIKIKFDNNKLDVLNNGPKQIRMCFMSSEMPIYVFDAQEDKDHKFVLMVLPVR
ncbi:MAG: hypothetical protein JEZ08_16480 [Clostridiales bacterium]|nr:hypothetical protein [Clostridiales bacterium]